MKHLLFFLFILVGLAGCSKDDDDTNNPELAGTWTGVWGLGSATPQNFERWILQANGHLESKNEQGNSIGIGSWTLSGQNFRANYTPHGVSDGLEYAGIYNATLKTIEGTWGWEPSVSDGGLFEMQLD